ncbi:MAG TPA: NAD(P)H-hydrate dehydratase [Acidimicrobiales bacterium]|jgi:NAD(P)H-hydrate epimerase|nr:NAD(P)H-hydrate dehydratase [Acidimicrobiales bacterium]
MIPVVTPAEMAEVDRDAPEPVDILVERAGYAVAGVARGLMAGTYGRRVVVVAGRGNNGADGCVAGRHLTRWGSRVEVLDPADLSPGHRLPAADLIIDAAFGTGLSRPYQPPDPGDTPVLAVDIPSGLSGVTGTGEAMDAVATVTFAAYKPGLLLGRGREKAGRVHLAGIGLDGRAAERAAMWLVTDADLGTLPRRPLDGHKWQTAVMVVGGSPEMPGAPLMVAHGAMRAGAGYALVGVPGAGGAGLPPGEQVAVSLPDGDWVEAAVKPAERARALAIGPGLGSAGHATGANGPVGRFLTATTTPAVVDAGAITALGSIDAVRAVADGRDGPIVLTPHEGEYAQLTGHRPEDDRITDVRSVARQTGAVVLLKGATTIVADPGGRVLIAAAGTPNLATAGSGDTLTGMIAAFMARGLEPLEAAGLAAHAHGRAAARGRPEGLVASDLPDLVSDLLSELLS